MENIKIGGRYRHYKGNEYTVLGIVKHSETLQDLVIYKAQYGDGQIWARPLSMFTETVCIDGKELPRFSLIDG